MLTRKPRVDALPPSKRPVAQKTVRACVIDQGGLSLKFFDYNTLYDAARALERARFEFYVETDRGPASFQEEEKRGVGRPKEREMGYLEEG
mgnify:CR=1 FL=1